MGRKKKSQVTKTPIEETVEVPVENTTEVAEIEVGDITLAEITDVLDQVDSDEVPEIEQDDKAELEKEVPEIEQDDKAELEKEVPEIEQDEDLSPEFGLNAVEKLGEDLVQEIFATKNPEAKLIEEIQTYIEEFDVSEEHAIKLAQRLLNIGQTGEIDERTKSAFNQYYSHADFINDYKNHRRRQGD